MVISDYTIPQRDIKTCLLSINDTIKNSEILFKDYKKKYGTFENDIDDLVEYFNHTNKLMNIYKWILFTCKTKEEFLEKIKTFTKPDGTKMNFTESQLERLWSLAPKMQKLLMILEAKRLIHSNEYGNQNMEVSYVEENYEPDQTGGAQEEKSNRRFVKICYKLPFGMPITLPALEFINFKFTLDDRICLDIERPVWPTYENMTMELLNKGDIKRCIEESCVKKYADVSIENSKEKQDCVDKCFYNYEPALFDYVFSSLEF